MRKRLAAFAVVLFCIACGSGLSPPAMTGGSHEALSLLEETGRWMLKQARARLTGDTRENARPPAQAAAPRQTILFITAFAGGHRLWPHAMMGRGESLASALDSALASASSSPMPSSERPAPDRIQIDVVDGQAVPFRTSDMTDERFNLAAPQLIDPGVEGILFESRERAVWLLPSEMILLSLFGEEAGDQTAADLLGRSATQLGFGREAWRSPGVKLSRFRTLSIVEDSSHGRPLKLVRCAVPVEEVNAARLNASARAGGDYLARMRKSDGSFHYSYDASRDRVSEREYNVVRHAGTAFSLFELYRATRDARYLEAANSAVGFLKTWFRPARQKSGVYVLDRDGKAKLGAAALALLALNRQIELDPRNGSQTDVDRLARFILSMQRKDGSFQSYHRVRGDEPADSVSLYYPGEAILALVNLYRLTGDKGLLEASRRGADYLIDSQRRMNRFPQDAWLMQALEALHGIKADKRYAGHALALAEAMMADQYGSDAPAGYAGGFGPGPPRSTPAASRAEGLLSAYRLGRASGDGRAQIIRESLMASARFQLAQQFDADNSFFLPNAARAAGGFRAGVTSMRIRIDFVQHNICSLLGLAEFLR